MDNKNKNQLTTGEKLKLTGQLISAVGSLFLYIALGCVAIIILYFAVHH